MSEAFFRRGQKRMPGGVSSPVRSFASVGGSRSSSRRVSARLRVDADGSSYLD